MASARASTKARAERVSTDQWGRRSTTTTSPSLRSRRGKGSSCSRRGQGAVVTGVVVGGTVVAAWVVVVRSVVVVRVPLVVLVSPPALDVEVPAAAAETRNLTVTMFDSTSRPVRSVGTVAGASPLTT